MTFNLNLTTRKSWEEIVKEQRKPTRLLESQRTAISSVNRNPNGSSLQFRV
jgi:hypothetical protein